MTDDKETKEEIFKSSDIKFKNACLISETEKIINIIKEYDYMAFIHDKRNNNIAECAIKERFFKKSLDNMLCSKQFITNVVDVFDSNNCLGMLSPIRQGCALRDEWKECQDAVITLVKNLGLTIRVDEGVPPIVPHESLFWFRTKTLVSIQEKYNRNNKYVDKIKDFDMKIMFKYLIVLYAQEMGYYSAYLLNDDSAYLLNDDSAYLLNDDEIKKIIDDTRKIYEDSTCWKITKPIRRIMDFLRGNNTK